LGNISRLFVFAVGLLSTVPAQAFELSENTLTETYGPTYKQPNIKKNHSNHGADVGQFRTNFEHYDIWQYGSNRVEIGEQQSNSQDPARSRGVGASQVYGAYFGTLSANRVLGGQPLTWGPVQDIRLDYGAAFNTKNSSLENQKKEVLFGGSVAFDVPGTLNLGAHVVHEWNHNGIVGKNFHYHPAAQITLYGEQPLGFTGLPLRVETIDVVETPKGRDGFGHETATSFFSFTALILDVGELLLHRPKKVDAFVAFQYWLNKAGDDHQIKSGAVEETAVFGVSYRF
jgi:hypothetical protein